ncbi:type II toxin-antitoxin system RelE/ParE family toxin [Edaphobacter sp.]|uniref:type II toxin-antitoxin system RelE/ParE family toxin n=1 Tax=Edaphobacter sp. TaxID=1934404 RepID=UPI002DB60BD4|nr:type II toxin-antitoxin system RelE/ParE family toxin [Edaphobacter sp.]HEU5342276.1 type II toxin-antitoxin system RelE/ParE family toxin [Edaphobacter sp.]
MAHRVAIRAEIDLDDIWYYIAKESSSIEIADHLVDSITNRFFLLAKYPYLGRSRDHEFGSGIRSFPIGEYVVLYAVEGTEVLILRVVHGHRDIDALFGNEPT